MANEFLSQDEVDTLLQGVVDEPDETAAERGIRAYKLGAQERIVRGRMPTLEIINDRFARLLRIGLFNFMRRSPEIAVSPARVSNYAEFIRTLLVPTNLNIATVKPLRGTSLFIFEPALVFLIIDNLFGGDGRFHGRVEGREFTQTEQRIIQRLLQVVFDDYQKAWQNVHPLKFEHVRSEMHPQFANIATPTEIVVVSSFNIDIAGQGGAMHICMPYAMLEPIRDLIHRPIQGDYAEPDRRWFNMLQKQLQLADVEIVANLASTMLPVRELMQLKVGDVVPIDMSPLLEARVDGVPVMECGYGEVNGHYALRVERLLKPERETKQGDGYG